MNFKQLFISCATGLVFTFPLPSFAASNSQTFDGGTARIACNLGSNVTRAFTQLETNFPTATIDAVDITYAFNSGVIVPQMTGTLTLQGSGVRSRVVLPIVQVEGLTNGVTCQALQQELKI